MYQKLNFDPFIFAVYRIENDNFISIFNLVEKINEKLGSFKILFPSIKIIQK